MRRPVLSGRRSRSQVQDYKAEERLMSLILLLYMITVKAVGALRFAKIRSDDF